MLDIRQHDQGVVIAIKASPGARNNEIRGIHNGALKVAVTQVAEKGKSNKAIIALLAKSLGVRKSQIELLAGSTSANKEFLISSCTRRQLQSSVSKLLEEE